MPISFILIFGISQSRNVLCLKWNNIYLVLETLRDNLLTANQSVTFFISLSIPRDIESIVCSWSKDSETDGQVRHYDDVIMSEIASQITSRTIVYSAIYSDADQRKHQSSPLLAFVRGIHRGPVNSPHNWPVTRKMFPFDDVLMSSVVRICNKCKLFGNGMHIIDV